MNVVGRESNRPKASSQESDGQQGAGGWQGMSETE